MGEVVSIQSVRAGKPINATFVWALTHGQIQPNCALFEKCELLRAALPDLHLEVDSGFERVNQILEAAVIPELRQIFAELSPTSEYEIVRVPVLRHVHDSQGFVSECAAAQTEHRSPDISGF